MVICGVRLCICKKNHRTAIERALDGIQNRSGKEAMNIIVCSIRIKEIMNKFRLQFSINIVIVYQFLRTLLYYQAIALSYLIHMGK